MKQASLSLRMVAATAAVVTGVLAFSANAAAHVVVRPADVVTAGFQTFTVAVPNEKEIPTTEVRIEMPTGLQYVQPTQKPGWRIDVAMEADGDDERVRSITWSGNVIDVGFRDEFTFSAKVPETAGELQWKAYQTYADGTVVAWDKAESGDSHSEDGDSNSGPYSVTRIVDALPADQAADSAKTVADESRETANLAMYVSVAAVVVSIIALFAATRKKS